MKRLLNIEFIKISNYKTARFFIIAYFTLLALASFGLSQNITIFGLELKLAEYGIFDFPNVWHWLTFFAAIAKLFLAIIIITTVTNEYSYGTLKQNLIDGLTKKEFIASKTLTIVVLSIASTVFVFIVALILGLVYTEGDYSIFAEFSYIPAYFLKLITFFAFCMFLALLVRKSAFAFALFFVWWIIESILGATELIVRMKVFGEEAQSIGETAISNYLPLASMSNVVPSPFKRIELMDMATQGQLNDLAINPTYVVLCIVYFILFTFLSYWLIKRRDL